MKAPSRRTYRILIVVAVAVLVACSWIKPIESAASEQIDAGLKRALATFATARALNAAISSVQGTEVSGRILGFGGTLSVGQVLDPVNDLVEQFSTLMLVASVAFGVHKALLAIGSNWVISALLTFCAAVWALLYLRRDHAPHWIQSFVVVLLAVRFAIPVAVIGSDQVFEALHARKYEESQSFITATSSRMDQVKPEDTGPEEKGLWDKMTARMRDVTGTYHQIKVIGEQATETIVSLAVIFLLQTIVVPIAILWFIKWAAQAFLRASTQNDNHRRSVI